MTVGSAVEVDIQGAPQYGVIRWIGHVRGDTKRRLLAGIEMVSRGGGEGIVGWLFGREGDLNLVSGMSRYGFRIAFFM